MFVGEREVGGEVAVEQQERAVLLGEAPLVLQASSGELDDGLEDVQVHVEVAALEPCVDRGPRVDPGRVGDDELEVEREAGERRLLLLFGEVLELRVVVRGEHVDVSLELVDSVLQAEDVLVHLDGLDRLDVQVQTVDLLFLVQVVQRDERENAAPAADVEHAVHFLHEECLLF